MSELNILVTAGGSAISQGIIKSLRMSDLNCHIVSTDMQPFAAGLYLADNSYLVPIATSARYFHVMEKICYDEDINCIFVGTDYELWHMAHMKRYLEKKKNLTVIVSDKQKISIALDKYDTNMFLVKNHFDNPFTTKEKDYDRFEKFPVVVKPRISDSSKGMSIVNTEKELKKKIFSSNFYNSYLGEKVGYVIQEYLDGDEYTASTLTIDGICKGVMVLKKEMRYPGHTTKAEIIHDPVVDCFIHRVAECYNATGPANFQFKLKNGIPMIFEINCRFSGTTPFCAMVGFNTVEACVKHYVLHQKINPLTIPSGGYFLRTFNEIFVEKLLDRKIC